MDNKIRSELSITMNTEKNKMDAPGFNYIRTQSGAVIAIPAPAGKPGKKSKRREKKAVPDDKNR